MDKGIDPEILQIVQNSIAKLHSIDGCNSVVSKCYSRTYNGKEEVLWFKCLTCGKTLPLHYGLDDTRRR